MKRSALGIMQSSAQGSKAHLHSPNEPMPRIDYIWVDESFQPVECQVITGWASDHLAATADLVVLSEGRGIRAQDGRGELVER